MLKPIVLAAAFCGLICVDSSCSAGWPEVKTGPLGPYQQKAASKVLGGVVGAGVTVYSTSALGPYGAAAVGAAIGHGVSNHAEKKWTGRGLENWRRPNHW